MRAVLATALPVLVAAAPASAAKSMEVGVADDRLLLGSAGSAAAAIAEWQAAGVDAVRIVARWGVYAPDPEARVPPDGFAAADHADPRYDWSALDRAIGMVD